MIKEKARHGLSLGGSEAVIIKVDDFSLSLGASIEANQLFESQD